MIDYKAIERAQEAHYKALMELHRARKCEIKARGALAASLEKEAAAAIRDSIKHCSEEDGGAQQLLAQLTRIAFERPRRDD